MLTVTVAEHVEIHKHSSFYPEVVYGLFLPNSKHSHFCFGKVCCSHIIVHGLVNER